MKKEIKKVKLKYSNKIEIELFDLSTLFLEYKSKLILPHRPNFYQIYLFENTETKLTIDENSLTILPDTLLFVNENTVLKFDEASSYQGKVLIFSDDFFCKTEADKTFLLSSSIFYDQPAFTLFQLTDSNKLFKESLNRIQLELELENDVYQFDILHNLLHNILLATERHIGHKDKQLIQKGSDLDFAILFKDLIDKNFLEVKMVSFYIDLLNISEKRLNQATSNTFSKTPKEMINDRIIQEAKRYLTFTNKSIKEIGVSLNFEDPSYFIKYFKKITTKTPIEFRKEKSSFKI